MKSKICLVLDCLLATVELLAFVNIFSTSVAPSKFHSSIKIEQDTNILSTPHGVRE